MSVTLNPYILFQGQARDALTFYQSVFGGELNISSYGDIPGMPVEEDLVGKVMHGQLNGDNGITLMASDGPSEPFNGSISVSGEDEATLRGYWDKLSDGAHIDEPMVQAPWGDIFGMLRDKFGVHWMINVTAAH